MTGALHVTEPTVVASRVSKWFGQKVAVSEVDCSFGPGITGLLGPNGAGKTTFLRLLAGVQAPSEGAVTLLGTDPRSDPEIYRRVGLVPEDEALHDILTAKQFLRWSAATSGLADPEAAADHALETVDLAEDAHRKIGKFSKGMRQRAKVAAALVHEPEVLLLDEPLNGADPVQRASLIDIFRRLAASGVTIIVSSHVLHEVERLADRVIAMVDGRIAAAGTIAGLRAQLTEIPLRVRVEADDPRRLASALVGEPWLEGVAFADSSAVFEVRDAGRLGTRIPQVAVKERIHIRRVVPEDESLESVFRYLLGRR